MKIEPDEMTLESDGDDVLSFKQAPGVVADAGNDNRSR